MVQRVSAQSCCLWDLLSSPLRGLGLAWEQNPPACPDRGGSRRAVPAGLQLETTGMRRGRADNWDAAVGLAQVTEERSPGPRLRCDVLLCTPCHCHACPGTWSWSPVLAPVSASQLFGRRLNVWRPQRKSTLMKCFPAVIGFPL